MTTSSHASAGRHAAAVQCRNCGAPVGRTFIDLGMSPLVQSFVPAEKLDAMEPYYPLNVLICEACKLVQLRDYVSPEAIFTEYAYFSSYSSSWVAHAKAYCAMIAQRLRLGPDSLAVEIASNDGYLLQHFLPMGVPVLGIEPAANVAEVARGKGVPTISEFFGVALARRLRQEGKRPNLILGNNVFAHVPDLNDFTDGLKILLAPGGVITLEFPHLERLMAETQFDTIYHEHFSYFSFVTVDDVARRHGLRLIDVEELPTHGGSLRVYMAHEEDTSHQASPRVAALLAREEAAGFREMDVYADFAQRVRQTKRDILGFLIQAKNAGKRVCGYGAPGKGNTLLNTCGIGPDYIDFTVDRNPYKQGHYTPGTHIPIKPVEALDEAKPDYIFVLPWNLRDEISAQLAYTAAWGAKLVFPIPHVDVRPAGQSR